MFLFWLLGLRKFAVLTHHLIKMVLEEEFVVDNGEAFACPNDAGPNGQHRTDDCLGLEAVAVVGVVAMKLMVFVIDPLRDILSLS